MTDITNLSIIVGLIASLIALITKAIRLKKEFLSKKNLTSSLSLIIFSFIAAFPIVSMINLAFIAYQNNFTNEIIQANRVYIAFAGITFAFAALIVYVILLMEEKPRKITKKPKPLQEFKTKGSSSSGVGIKESTSSPKTEEITKYGWVRIK